MLFIVVFILDTYNSEGTKSANEEYSKELNYNTRKVSCPKKISLEGKLA